MKAHRLVNLAQHYESLNTLATLATSQDLVGAPSTLDLTDLTQQRDGAESTLLKGIRAFNENQGLDPDRPVLINEILYCIVGDRLGRFEPLGLEDIVTNRTLQTVEKS